MTRDDIIRLALEHFGAVLKPSDFEVKFAALVAAEKNKEIEQLRSEVKIMRDALELITNTAIRASST